MFYKISNNCTRNTIENKYNRSFIFPDIYEAKPIINGLEECLVPIITSQEKANIRFAIWGMLPHDYKGDWQDYQNSHNTLNMPIGGELTNYTLQLSQTKKCVIIVSGFFINFLKNGKLYTYYVYKENEEPFLLGGLHTKLEDGYFTCSIYYTKANNFIKKISNTNNLMPLIINDTYLDDWLAGSLKNVNNHNTDEVLFAHTISKDFYDNTIIFGAVLKPIPFKNVPNFLCPKSSFNH